MISPFERIKTQDQDLRFLQDNVAAVFKDIAGRTLLDGRLIEAIAITAGTAKTVSHNLGRKLVGWSVVRKDAGAEVWESITNDTIPTRTIVLNASADVTISLWVF